MSLTSKKAYNLAYYAANREKAKAAAKAYRAANKERISIKLKIYRAANADKVRAAEKRWRSENTEKYKAYGKERYIKAGRDQQRRRRGLPSPTRPEPSTCESCGTPTKKNGCLRVDHCHATGRFRGWLCNKCNLGLGALGDMVESVKKILKYLERSNDVA